MTQEERQLLLKDLCARSYYGVNCDRLGVIRKVLSINPNRTFCVELDNGEYVSNWYSAEDVKPYLRPLSSMTEDEKKYVYRNFSPTGQELFSLPYVDWLNEHHFDYRGLIEKGLALEAPKDMYN